MTAEPNEEIARLRAALQQIADARRYLEATKSVDIPKISALVICFSTSVSQTPATANPATHPKKTGVA
jgi:hypothetical protein